MSKICFHGRRGKNIEVFEDCSSEAMRLTTFLSTCGVRGSLTSIHKQRPISWPWGRGHTCLLCRTVTKRAPLALSVQQVPAGRSCYSPSSGHFVPWLELGVATVLKHTLISGLVAPGLASWLRAGTSDVCSATGLCQGSLPWPSQKGKPVSRQVSQRPRAMAETCRATALERSA